MILYNYTKEKFLELVRNNNFPNYATFTCLSKACQEFIFILSQVIDLLCPSIKSRLKASSKHWTDSETISTIRRRDKLFKKYNKFSLETEKYHFRSTRIALHKAISKKKKSNFREII